MLSRKAPGCPVCGCPQIPWPGREGRHCVHGHGLAGAPGPAPAAEPLEGFAYRFGIDLSRLGTLGRAA